MNFYEVIGFYDGTSPEIFDGLADGRVIKEVREFCTDTEDVEDDELIISFVFEDGIEIQIAAVCEDGSASYFEYVRGPIGKEVLSTKIVNYKRAKKIDDFEFDISFEYGDGTSLDVRYCCSVEYWDISMQWIEPEEKEGWRPLQRGEDGSILEDFGD